MPESHARDQLPGPRLYRVACAAKQQLILRGLLILDRPGVTAAGSQLGSDCFVIVAAQTNAALRTTHTMVLALDPLAELLPPLPGHAADRPRRRSHDQQTGRRTRG